MPLETILKLSDTKLIIKMKLLTNVDIKNEYKYLLALNSKTIKFRYRKNP